MAGPLSSSWDPSSGGEEPRAFLQQRLARFIRLWLWMLPLFGLGVIGLYELYPELRPASSGMVHAIAVAVLAPLLVIAVIALHRRRLGFDALFTIDAGAVTVMGALFGLSAYFSSDLQITGYTVFLWQTFVCFSRVVMVPSTPRRTAIVSAVSYLPILAASVGVAIVHPEHLLLPAPAQLVTVTLFAAAAVVLAVTGTTVIYGLRQEVSAARQLGQYTLETVIGEGGMGVVYRARHAMLRRPTAVKLLPASRSSAAAVARFEREVQLTSRLTHPGTVAVYDYGRSRDGTFYYAMELIDGVDLATLVRADGPQPPARVIHVLRQVCGALDEAHRTGLIHRDIKPANILLCQRPGQPDVAKVVDFGLVKELDADDDDPAAGRTVVGTPAYLSPEAVTAPSTIGPASDLYGVGGVAYFLLTGQYMFDGSPVEVCRHHVTTAPPPPSTRTDRPIPPTLETVVLACLAKDPAARPASARALGDALAAVDAGAWTEADAEGWWAAFRARPSRSLAFAAPTQAPQTTMTVDLDRRPS